LHEPKQVIDERRGGVRTCEPINRLDHPVVIAPPKKVSSWCLVEKVLQLDVCPGSFSLGGSWVGTSADLAPSSIDVVSGVPTT
jgi:hypothetical protein